MAFDRFIVTLIAAESGRAYARKVGMPDSEAVWFDLNQPSQIGYDHTACAFQYCAVTPPIMHRNVQIDTVIVGATADEPDQHGSQFLRNWAFADQYDVIAKMVEEFERSLWAILMELHELDPMMAVQLARGYDRLGDTPTSNRISIAVGDARLYLYAGDFFPECSGCNGWIFPDTAAQHAEHTADSLDTSAASEPGTTSDEENEEPRSEQ